MVPGSSDGTEQAREYVELLGTPLGIAPYLDKRTEKFSREIRMRTGDELEDPSFSRIFDSHEIQHHAGSFHGACHEK